MRTRLISFSTAFIFIVLAGCATPPPKKPENICEIFREHRSWYFAAKDARDRWGVPIHVPMAMMYQESSFKANAQPPIHKQKRQHGQITLESLGTQERVELILMTPLISWAGLFSKHKK